MSALTVVGLGSELSGDDAVGLVLVEALGARLSVEEARSVTCVCWPDVDALTIAHELLELRGDVLIVDCAEMGLPPASARLFERDQVRLGVKERRASVHGVGLAEGLELAARLGRRGPVRLFAVQPFRVGPGAPLSSEMEERLPALADALEEAVRSRMDAARPGPEPLPRAAAGAPVEAASDPGKGWANH